MFKEKNRVVHVKYLIKIISGPYVTMDRKSTVLKIFPYTKISQFNFIVYFSTQDI